MKKELLELLYEVTFEKSEEKVPDLTIDNYNEEEWVRYANERYYTERPLHIPESSNQNHINIPKLIGQIGYIECPIHMFIVRKGVGKTYNCIVCWCIERYNMYGELFCIITRREITLQSYLPELKKDTKIWGGDFKIEGRHIIHKRSRKKAGMLISITGSISGGANNDDYTNFFFDEFLTNKFDPIPNEVGLLTVIIRTLSREKWIVARLIMCGNALYIGGTYLNQLNVDWAKFTKKNYMQWYRDEITGTNAKLYYFQNDDFNTLNTAVRGTIGSSFGSQATQDFLSKGTFAFENMKNYWSPRDFTVFRVYAGYILRGEIFYECDIEHDTSREKVVGLVPKAYMDFIPPVPMFILNKEELLENDEFVIHPEAREIMFRWMRQLGIGKLKLGGFTLKDILKNHLLEINVYNLLQKR